MTVLEPQSGPVPPPSERRVSVVIPARNEVGSIARLVGAVRAQAQGAPAAALARSVAGVALEVIVVDDGSADDTAGVAEQAGARVIRMQGGGNPAAARNRGAAAATGDPIIFLDADCTPAPGWLAAFLAAHDRGELIVGGSLDLPPGLPSAARCDYYCGWYLVHSRRPAGYVPHHPPPNLSVRRDAFRSTSGFSERAPLGYTNEERAWQGELQRQGHRIYFEPRARTFHHNRPGFGNLLRRNYRWGYTALEAKSGSRAARLAWLYEHPQLLIAATPLLALAHTAYIVGLWLRAGVTEPIAMLPAILASRVAYVAGMAVGGTRWLRRRGTAAPASNPRWQ